MTDLRTAAQQALEALKGYRRELNDQQPCDAEQALRAALAEPEQEPVAWRLWDEDPQGGGDWRYYDAKDFKNGINPTEYFDGLVPLYTAPPQRKPLSAADALRIATEAIGLLQSVGPVQGLVGLVRAIEAAHGIK